MNALTTMATDLEETLDSALQLAPSPMVSKPPETMNASGRSSDAAPVSHTQVFTTTLPFSSCSNYMPSSRPTTPEAVVTILNSMSANDHYRRPRRSSPETGNSEPLPITPFLLRKLAPRPDVAMPGTSSEHSNHLIEVSTNARVRAISQDSAISLSPRHQLLSMSTLGNEDLRPRASTSSSQEAEPAGRVVGRGGRGSRPRIVTTQQVASPKPQILNAKLNADSSSPMPLRPSGRGGLASRPKQLAPPSPPSKSPTSDTKVQSQPIAQTVFIRPTGRGGFGSRTQATPPLNLVDILKKNKLKPSSISISKSKSRPKRLEVTSSHMHPFSANTASGITNTSNETLSTIHFAGDSESSFLPEGSNQDLAINSSKDVSSTLLFTATSSTLEDFSSLQSIADDDSDVDVYLGDAPYLTPAAHRQRSMNKLARTFGTNPYEMAAGFSTNGDDPGFKQSLPKTSVAQDALQQNKPSNMRMLRRANLSMTSLFSRPSRRRNSIGLSSQNTLDTITDDLHQLGLLDDLSESWDDNNTSQISGYDKAESPIMFSSPSPLPRADVKPAPLGADEEFAISSTPTTLTRSHSHTLPSRRQNSRLWNHNHSISTSLVDHAFADTNDVSSVNWLFPPSGSENDFKLTVTHKNLDKPTPWTGEWNTEMHDVIKALRELR